MQKLCRIAHRNGQMRLMGRSPIANSFGEDIELPYHFGSHTTAQSKTEQTSAGAGESSKLGT
jgi:hypothetical protein